MWAELIPLRSSASRWRRLTPWLVALGLLVVVLAINLNALHNEFLSWDDTLLLTENPRVQVDSFAGLLRVFSPSDALAGRHLEYLPLRDFCYAVIFYFRGLSPLPFHLVQILAHAVTCFLVFWCARPWIRDRAAALAAFLFAIHPVHVESVVWISCLKDPTFTGCTLLSVGLYFRSQRGRPVARGFSYAGALLAMIAALGFKQIAVAIPALLFAVDYAFARRRTAATVLYKIPFVLVVLAVLPLYLVIGSRSHVIIAPPGGTRFTGFLTMTYVYAEYLGKLIAPFSLSPRYVVRPVLAVSDPRFLLSAAVIVGVWFVAFAVRRRTRVPLFVLLWLTASVLPVMNIIPIPIEMADRYLYLPSVGFVIGVGAGIVALIDRVGATMARGIVAATVAVGIVWSLKSFAGNETWKNDVTLWSAVIERSPEFYIGRTSLGAAYLRRGDAVAAERELRTSLATFPGDATAYLNLGELLRRQKRYAEAKDAFRHVIELKPNYAQAYNNLAAVSMDEGNWQEARVSLEQALALSPQYPTAHRNFAIVCMKLADPDCALRHMRSAIDARPANRGLFLDWLNLLRATNSAALALPLRDRIERQFPDDAEVWESYAELLAQGGLEQSAEAFDHANSVRARRLQTAP